MHQTSFWFTLHPQRSCEHVDAYFAAAERWKGKLLFRLESHDDNRMPFCDAYDFFLDEHLPAVSDMTTWVLVCDLVSDRCICHRQWIFGTPWRSRTKVWPRRSFSVLSVFYPSLQSFLLKTTRLNPNTSTKGYVDSWVAMQITCCPISSTLSLQSACSTVSIMIILILSLLGGSRLNQHLRLHINVDVIPASNYVFHFSNHPQFHSSNHSHVQLSNHSFDHSHFQLISGNHCVQGKEEIKRARVRYTTFFDSYNTDCLFYSL